MHFLPHGAFTYFSLFKGFIVFLFPKKQLGILVWCIVCYSSAGLWNKVFREVRVCGRAQFWDLRGIECVSAWWCLCGGGAVNRYQTQGINKAIMGGTVVAVCGGEGEHLCLGACVCETFHLLTATRHKRTGQRWPFDRPGAVCVGGGVGRISVVLGERRHHFLSTLLETSQLLELNYSRQVSVETLFVFISTEKKNLLQSKGLFSTVSALIPRWFQLPAALFPSTG